MLKSLWTCFLSITFVLFAVVERLKIKFNALMVLPLFYFQCTCFYFESLVFIYFLVSSLIFFSLLYLTFLFLAQGHVRSKCKEI